MTTFQPGDVVRLTGAAWGPALTGTEQVVVAGEFDGDTDRYFIHDGDRYFVGAFAWTAERVALSPQAVLDAILDGAEGWVADEGQEWVRYWVTQDHKDFLLTARKVDGHWLVRGVNTGGGE